MAAARSSTRREGQRSYHHGNLRAALLQAALDQTRAGGAAALNLREATRQVGVSPNAAYRHFSDRRSLLGAVAIEAQQRMAARMRERFEQGPPATTAKDQARERLRAVGLGYIDFARAEPGWFEVGFFGAGKDGPDADVRRAETPVPPPYQLLVDALDEMVAAGALDPVRKEPALWACWSTVHGFAELTIQGPLREQPEGVVSGLAEQAVAAIITGVTTTRSP